MKMRDLLPVLCTFAVVLASSVALADGDPNRGRKIFNKCKMCHVVDSNKNKIGPSLHGVVGRDAGSAPGYKYSKANRESGLTWDEATLFKYLAGPRKFLKGTKMTFRGLKKEQDRWDVIAYIKSVGTPTKRPSGSGDEDTNPGP